MPSLVEHDYSASQFEWIRDVGVVDATCTRLTSSRTGVRMSAWGRTTLSAAISEARPHTMRALMTTHTSPHLTKPSQLPALTADTNDVTGVTDARVPATPPPACAGVHVTLPDYYSPENVGMIVPKTKDGRVVFMLPWEGATIAGTTDAPSAVTMAPRASEADVEFILSAIDDFLAVEVRPIPTACPSSRPRAGRPLFAAVHA